MASKETRRFEHLIGDERLREDIPALVRAVRGIDPKAVQRPARTERYPAVLLMDFPPDHEFLDANVAAGVIVPLARVHPKLQERVMEGMREVGLNHSKEAIFFIPMNKPGGSLDDQHIRSSEVTYDRELVGIVPHYTFKGGGPKQKTVMGTTFYSLPERLVERRYFGVSRLPTIRTVWRVSRELGEAYHKALEEGDITVKMASELGVREALTLRPGALFKPLQYPLTVGGVGEYSDEQLSLLTESERRRVEAGGREFYPVHRAIEFDMASTRLFGLNFGRDTDVELLLNAARIVIPDILRHQERGMEHLKGRSNQEIVGALGRAAMDGNTEMWLDLIGHGLREFMRVRLRLEPVEVDEVVKYEETKDGVKTVISAAEAFERFKGVIEDYRRDLVKMPEEAVVFGYSVPLQIRVSELSPLKKGIRRGDFGKWAAVFKHYDIDLEGEFRGEGEGARLRKMRVYHRGQRLKLDDMRAALFNNFMLAVAVNCRLMWSRLRGSYTIPDIGSSLSDINVCATGHVVDLDTCRTNLSAEEAEAGRREDMRHAKDTIGLMLYRIFGYDDSWANAGWLNLQWKLLTQPLAMGRFIPLGGYFHDKEREFEALAEGKMEGYTLEHR